MRNVILGAALALAAVPASAQVVDGQNTGGTEYAGGVSVASDPNAPTSNFGTPGNTATAGYTIQLNDTNGSLYGLLTLTDGSAVGSFANLYFDLDRATRSGSDLGFEIGQNGVNAFIPENGSKVALDASLFSVATTANSLEFRLDNSLFNAPIAGLTYNPNVTFTGDNRLNLSQSFSYSVAGGTSYGAGRLGTFASTAAVPEPSTWALMLLGFGGMGVAMRRQRRSATLLAQVA
ncbi:MULTISPECIES: PEPxxWA-CTERM sorting domain-containing protein [Sphingomonas]|uniref:PEPxxWA-CTERM sorting domain-containing protein n=1 Tax=Sphingomonas TaxID=13687 RepID=UPI000DEFF677|nr:MULTISPECIES: PEPxxWA-CTERM sorting domain-containing protein [Sphingomonas]